MMFRHSAQFMESRICKEPLHRQPAKQLELEFSAVLVGHGISTGEALRLAEECARDPQALAERLHQISNAYLHTMAMMQRACAPTVPPEVREAIAAIDGSTVIATAEEVLRDLQP